MRRSEDLAQTTIEKLAASDMLVVFLHKEVVLLDFRLQRLVWTSYNRGVEEEGDDRVQVKLALVVLIGLQADRSLQHSPDPLYVPSSSYVARAHK